jgi:hypothetical protein
MIMKKSNILLVTKKMICLPFVMFAVGTYAQDQAKTLDSLFTSLYAQKKFNGNVLVAEKGKPIFEKVMDWQMKKPEGNLICSLPLNWLLCPNSLLQWELFC